MTSGAQRCAGAACGDAPAVRACAGGVASAPRRPATWWRALVVTLVVFASAVPAGARCRPPALDRWQQPGPLPVARTTLTIVDASRPTPPNGAFPGAPSRTLVTEVWYPAAGERPFPLVVASHGFTGSRTTLAYLAEHLASHGYVVAAPQFPLSTLAAPGGPTTDDIENQPGDVSAVIDHLLAASAGPLAGAVDAARIGVTGLSWGGLTTLLVTFHETLADARIRAALPIAAPACFVTPAFFRGAAARLLLLYGDDDLLVSFAESGPRAFKAARRRRQLAVLHDAAHSGFSAYTATLPSETHYDLLTCALLATQGGADPLASLADLAAPGAGVALRPGRCPATCAPERVDAASGPVMHGARQQELTRLLAAVFFDAWLRDDADAKCAAKRGLRRRFDDATVRGG